MADQDDIIEERERKLVLKLSQAELIPALLLFVLVLIDWGMIPLGMDGNLIVRIAIFGMIAFQIFSALNMIRMAKQREPK
jgi:hypothetical protein